MKFVSSTAENALNTALTSVGTKNRVIICGAPEEKKLLEEQISYSETSVSKIIESSLAISPDTWFSERKKSFIDEYSQYGLDLSELEGVWPGAMGGQSISSHRDILTGEFFSEVLLAQLTIAEPWEIPAHFRYGGWNECPGPEVQCAIWKHWYANHGAEIVSVTHDVIEAWIPRPPKTKEDSVSLAWEQFLFCTDIVLQGVQTIGNLAGTLSDSNSWYFWWD